jgi:hypothetical protein
MSITRIPYAKKIITDILKPSSIKRGFFSIKNVLPPESKKPYTYVIPKDITPNGKVALDNFYQTTERLWDKTNLTEDSLTKKLYDNNHFQELTKELKKKT